MRERPSGYQRPWLDGIVALSSVVHDSGDMQLVTSVSPPVVRGPVTLAKAAGIGRVFLWPLAEPQAQLDRVMSTVVPVLDAG